MDEAVQLQVNGVRREVQTDPDATLLEILRNDLGLTGTKYGCGESQCGACTVLLEGMPIRSCTAKLSEVGELRITTIEGLAKDGKLHPIQQAFIDEFAMQCGYCVPGMILTAHDLLARIPNPTDAQIAEGMEGNLCRCCNYPRIVNAIRSAAKAMRGGE